jgi:hypothetical protein
MSSRMFIAICPKYAPHSDFLLSDDFSSAVPNYYDYNQHTRLPNDAEHEKLPCCVNH